jgi:hypothetical protein
MKDNCELFVKRPYYTKVGNYLKVGIRIYLYPSRMWLRDKNGQMRQVMRENFHTDTEYYSYIKSLIFNKK